MEIGAFTAAAHGGKNACSTSGAGRRGGAEVGSGGEAVGGDGSPVVGQRWYHRREEPVERQRTALNRHGPSLISAAALPISFSVVGRKPEFHICAQRSMDTDIAGTSFEGTSRADLTVDLMSRPERSSTWLSPGNKVDVFPSPISKLDVFPSTQDPRC